MARKAPSFFDTSPATIGRALAIIGAFVIAYFAFIFSSTVSTGIGEVHNLERGNTRIIGVIIGVMILLIGFILAIVPMLAKNNRDKDQDDDEEDDDDDDE